MKVTITSTCKEFTFTFHNTKGDVIVDYNDLDEVGKELAHDTLDRGLLRLVRYLESK
jgi:hypothetical protein